MTRRGTTLFALVCALALGVPTMAGAASSDTPSAAISDCNAHSQLTAHYSPSTLQAALHQMPADVREYTDCYDVIQRALFAELGKTKPGGGSGSAAPASSGGSSFPTWLIIVLVILALAAVTFGALAIRRRRTGPTDLGPPGPGAPPPPAGPPAT